MADFKHRSIKFCVRHKKIISAEYNRKKFLGGCNLKVKMNHLNAVSNVKVIDMSNKALTERAAVTKIAEITAIKT